jgi:hypothetical protein
MENLLPVLPILAFFVLSLLGERHLKTSFGVVLSCGALTFFLIMAFVDNAHMYAYLFFAILAVALGWRMAKSSGLIGK